MFPEITGFKITKMLGEGAMAKVFLAIDNSLDRKVAMKVMTKSLILTRQNVGKTGSVR